MNPQEPGPSETPSLVDAPLTRRRLLAVASLGSVASVLGGCGSGSPGAPAPVVSEGATASAAQGAVGPIGQVVQANLEQVKATVSAIADPVTGKAPVTPTSPMPPWQTASPPPIPSTRCSRRCSPC